LWPAFFQESKLTASILFFVPTPKTFSVNQDEVGRGSRINANDFASELEQPRRFDDHDAGPVVGFVPDHRNFTGGGIFRGLLDRRPQLQPLDTLGLDVNRHAVEHHVGRIRPALELHTPAGFNAEQLPKLGCAFAFAAFPLLA
jgi:hypothetical protein